MLATLSTIQVDFTKIPNLAKNDEAFCRLASSPRLVAAVGAPLSQPALIFRDVLVAKPARDGASFTYHQDSEYWDVKPPVLLSAWMPLRDVGIEDGCLRVIQGSHRRRYPHDLLLGGGRALPRWSMALLRKMATLAGTGDSDGSNSTIPNCISVYRLRKVALFSDDAPRNMEVVGQESNAESMSTKT
jgi:hypothetical protein